MSGNKNSDPALSKDLPLMANVKDVMVRHYMIKLRCDMTERIFYGEVLIFLDVLHSGNVVEENLESKECKDEFVCVLDCCDIKITQVQELVHSDEDLALIMEPKYSSQRWEKEKMEFWLRLPRVALKYKIDEWSLNIWKDKTNKFDFPKVVCIEYETTLKSSSVTWTLDQNGRDCVYTQGSWINNRSLFPCQEPPIAMATWQALVSVCNDAVVLMTGDENPEINYQTDENVEFYYFTRMVLPMSTLALAIGFWKCEEIVSNEAVKENKSLIQCRLFASDKMLETAKKVFSSYLPSTLAAAKKTLGPHPFGRLDILVAPRSFASLGLASPNLLFISQSIISEDGSMSVHLAHEISHSWFGLSIGARDWTEEWLSEGFATFVEDIIHSCAMNQDSKKAAEVSEIRSLLRHHLLKAELEETDADLQILRPSTEIDANYVKNGLNHWKAVSQVHYLKGYFLLRHLSSLVGIEEFVGLLRDYVIKYHGQLVLSRDFFQFYFDRFPHINNPSIDKIYNDWLDYPGIPKDLMDFKISSENSLYQPVMIEYDKWMCFNSITSKRQKKIKLDFDLFEVSDQLILLLELLLKVDHLTKTTLKQLNAHFQLDRRNAHIKHRWCELIIKHDLRRSLKTVVTFLQEDQAMGVYLYGELNLSRKRHHRQLVKTCFEELKSEMDSSSRQIVNEILYQK